MASHWRLLIGVLIHAALAAIAYLVAFLLRYEYVIPDTQWSLFLRSLPLLILIRTLVFTWLHVHEGRWRYVGIHDLTGIFRAVSVSSLLFIAALVVFQETSFPRSVLLLDWLLCFVLVAGARLLIRIVLEASPALRFEAMRSALIVGAGDAGERLIREIHRDLSLKYMIVGLVDDSPKMQRQRIHGVQVLGRVSEIPSLCSRHGITDVLLAVPSATEEERRSILMHCRESGVVVRTVPSISDLWTGRASIGQLQTVTPEDLLGRGRIIVETDRLSEQIRGKSVMVTGAGGSIGSELCRQLAALKPGTLVAYDRAETSLYWLQLELARSCPDINFTAVVGDVLDDDKLDEVMREFTPHCLYHAAAYKHVPLMEEHVFEAITNNVFGTESVIKAAEVNGIRRVVLISTDKAVHPVNVMGMTKRLAEDLLLSRPRSLTTHVAVRFGNVLGSAGSVKPLFEWQMATGGPITITDPEVTRYFMLIVEAAQLVLQAGAMGRGSEIFLLDMGTPVAVMDLAEDLIRLSGLDPRSDVQVETVGLRPGEKLREELVRETEQFLASGHEQIFVLADRSFDSGRFCRDLVELRRLVDEREEAGARKLLRQMAQRSVDVPRTHSIEASGE